jgi:MFS family permease
MNRQRPVTYRQCPVTYRDVFRVGEFRAMFTAQVASLLGDQAAAVALAVLLYQRTGSALVAALGYATAYLPWTVGGIVLAPLADRIAPRRLLVTCDLARAGLIGLAAIPGMPLPVIGALILVAAFFAPPFEAAHASLLPQVLPGDRYAVGLSVGNAVHQSAQLAGFLLGGALVVAISSNGALAVDAVSFALSALLLRRGLARRPAAGAGVAGVDDAPRSLLARMLAETTEGLRLVAADRRRFGPLLLGAVGAAYAIVPEAIAPAYVHSLGHGAPAVGLVMASVAGGTVVGNLLLGRFATTARRQALMWPMALAGTVPLTAVLLRPGLVLSVVLFAVAGAAAAFQVAANTAFVAAVPVAVRGRAFGVAMTGMYAAQALAIVAAGAAASVLDPRTVVVVAAVLGALVLLVLRVTALRGDAVVDLQATVGRAPVVC